MFYPLSMSPKGVKTGWRGNLRAGFIVIILTGSAGVNWGSQPECRWQPTAL
jgi:hypothetical protein